MSGSSPRMRGTRRISRLIATRPRDHPRVCGEHFKLCLLYTSDAADDGERVDRGRETRIIPAYAGNTSSAMLNSFSFRDHPRVCGEHQHRAPETAMELGSSPRMRGTHAISTFFASPEGSSPRMRGTHGEQVVGDGEFGIIPAYAGNTSNSTPARWPARDHPRVCGEHFSWLV